MGSGLILLFGLSLLQSAPATSVRPTEAKATTPADQEIADKLRTVRRIYVEGFGEDSLSKTLHGMVITALHESKRFIITENKERADAVLKGSTVEKTSQELHATGEGTSVAGAAGGYSGSISGSATRNSARVSGSESGGFLAGALGTADSQASAETVNDARLAVRLVSSDGDVLWATTQESKGAKFRGASADVADKVAKQLLRDIEKLSRKP